MNENDYYYCQSIGLQKRSGKWLKVREKTVKSQRIFEWILSGNPEIDPPLFTANSVDYKPIVRIEHNLAKIVTR